MDDVLNELQLQDVEILSKKLVDGVLYYEVSPKNRPDCCPRCQSTHISKNGRAARELMDSYLHDTPVVICVRSNRFICAKCGKSITNSISFAKKGGKTTARLRAQIKKRCLDWSIKQLKEEYGVSVRTISTITAEHIAELESKWTYYTPNILGLSNVKIGKNTRVLCLDVERNGIIDILEKSDKDSLTTYFTNNLDFSKLDTAVIGFNDVHRGALRNACDYLRIAIDKRYVLERTLSATRSELRGVDSKIVNLILRNPYNLLPSERDQLLAALDEDKRLKRINDVKNKIYDMYQCHTQASAGEIFEGVYDEVLFFEKDVYLIDLVQLIDSFSEEVFNFFDANYSGMSIGNAVKLVKSVEKKGNGYSFKTLRARLLFGQKAAKATKTVYTSGGDSFGLMTGHHNFNRGSSSREEFLGNYAPLDALLEQWGEDEDIE